MLKKITSYLLIALLAVALLPTYAHADAGTNLITNPSLETSTNGTAPDAWQTDSWGTNTPVFTYLNTGHTGSHSVEIQLSNEGASGAADWYPTFVPVTPGATYQYTDWYQSNVDTEVDFDVEAADNSVTYGGYLGVVPASATWAKFTATFTAPAGTQAVSVYHPIAANGYLITDDYSLTTYSATPFSRGIVSVSFDDGWANQLENAEPVLKQYGIPGTYNIISGEMTNPDEAGYMTSAQVLSLYNDGNGTEIASHTVHHCDLTDQQTDDASNCPLNLTPTQVQQMDQTEMADSQTQLQQLIGAPVTDFAYPYGAFNESTVAIGKQYYLSQRTVNSGYNTKDNLDPTQLKIYEVDSNITPAQVEAWIDGAKADNAWLILVYHEVTTTPSDPSDATYTTSPTDFATEMAYLHNAGIATETVANALRETSAQVVGMDQPVVSNITTSGATITWNTVTGSSTQLNYGTTSAYGATTPLDSTLVTSHSVTLTGLTANTSYHYQAASQDANTNLAMSADLTFTTGTATAPIPTAPGMPTATTPTNNRQPTVAWATSTISDNSALTYTLEWSADQTFATVAGSTTTADLSVAPTAPLTDGTWYFRVKATSTSNVDSAWSPVGSVAIDTTGPTISDINVSSLTSSSVVITWTTSEAVGSQLQYGTDPSTYGTPTPVDSPSTTHSVTLTGLTAATTYHYQILASDALGNQAALADNVFTTLSATIPTIGDLDDNGLVNDDDAIILFANWGSHPGTTNTPGDLNHNGVVDDDDAIMLFANWSK